MRFPRSSGILLHIPSLPSPYGIGDLGPGAYEFVEFLQASGQTIWQILPLGPPAPLDEPGHGNSPYSCYSAFAGNSLLISPSILVGDGLLDQADVSPLDTPETKVDYRAVSRFKRPLLERAFANFLSSATGAMRESFDAFCGEHTGWLEDFARFEAIMRHFGQPDWTQWPSELVQRSESAIEEWDERLQNEITFSKFVQFTFESQWKRLKQYAGERQVRMYGDMPIFVAHHSADVWANQELFCLDESGIPTCVAGVPPDYFSKTGQLWGNPQYNWDALESTDYAWWTARFGGALRQFDLLRVDHFRAFEAYWEIPAGAASAVNGEWRAGPGEKPFQAARKQLGQLPIIAEDLGLITEEVLALRDRLEFPGMRVLQFGFETEEDDFHRPSQYPEHSVAYTGTHDNDTVMGWYHDRKPDPEFPDPLDAYITSDRDIHWQLIQAVLESKSDTAIVPMQDTLGLGNEARMNVPGEAAGNWTWRVSSTALTDDLASRLREMTADANR